MSLFHTLNRLDGASYGAYKSLRGRYRIGQYEIRFDHIQADPYAPPSRVTVYLPQGRVQNALTTVAARDLLARRIQLPRGIFIDTPGQTVLPRAAVTEDGRIRLEIQLPARGRRILGRQAAHLICDDLPEALDSLDFPQADIDAAIALWEDQEYIRHWLLDQGLVAFVANGAILPRTSGNTDTPLSGAIPFDSPDTLLHSLTLPSGKKLQGMGVPQGVTLIIGGGYHGKSTLLTALQEGVYNHVAGDGREFVITRGDAVALRAEDGRAVAGVDISPFITGLAVDTTAFSTANASGSTSQAAALMEALEAQASVLIIDEDTSATNFMVSEPRLRSLVPHETISPLITRVRRLWEDCGISTVVVSGSFLDVADTVILMDEYRAADVTEAAREVVRRTPHEGWAQSESSGDCAGQGRFKLPTPRIIMPLPHAPKPPRSRGLHSIQYGKETIDLSALNQIVDSSQTEAIARYINRIHPDGRTSLVNLVQQALEAGLDSDKHPGHLAQPRLQEIMAALNRFRALKVVPNPD